MVKDKITEDNLEIREMQEEDLDRIREIELLSFNSPWSKESFIYELFQNRLARYIVMEQGEEIVAYMGMWFIHQDIHITNFAVAPEYRKLGFGRRLLNFIVFFAKTKGFKYITLEVRRSNEIAQNLYQGLGFKVIGVRPSYYRDNQEDAILMQKRISRGVFDDSEQDQNTGN